MDNANYKIKAFTLSEILVVIVISTIVVGLAFTVLGIVQKNMKNIESNYTYQTSLQSLEVSLSIDFNRYTAVNWNPNEKVLLFSSPIQNKTYQFYKDSIVTSTNTFRVKTKISDFFFEGKPISTGTIDAVKLTFENTNDLYKMFVFKHNDPSIHF